MEAFLQLLASGSDAATIALVVALWRLDRRLLIIETKIERTKTDV